MDLMQENPNEENKVKSLKTSLIIIISFALALIIIAVIIYVYSLRVSGEQFKVKVDGTSNIELAKEENAFIIEDNNVYVSIKDVIPKMGFEIQNGEYKQYTEDVNSCYAKNKNKQEIVSFKSGSKEIKKYKAPFDNAEYKAFDLEEPIANRSGKLYISYKDLSKALGITAEYDKATNTVSLTTLPYLTTIYASRFPEAYLTKKEDDTSQEMTELMFFNNQKALLSNYVVVKNSESNLLGVSKYENDSLKETITQRYKTVEYVEGAEDFIVKTEEGKYGIISSDGIAKIKPEYDEIEEIDKNLGLYLYTQNGKKGIVNQSGKNIVYPDYDQIGLDPDYVDLNVKNKFLLYDKCIPVNVDKKWGIVDINGKKIVEPKYDGIGYKMSSSDPNTTGIVIIPELEGIVVEIDEKQGDSTIKKFGVINLNGEVIVNVVAEEAYAITIENKTTYYLTFQNQQIDIVSYWRENNNKIDEENDEQSQNQVSDQSQEPADNGNQNSGESQQNVQLTDEERNRIIQDIYNQLSDEQKAMLQQMSESEQQQAIQQYYDQYVRNQQQ